MNTVNCYIDHKSFVYLITFKNYNEASEETLNIFLEELLI